jgi:Xaa-Pro aminopeptidase
MRTLHSVLKRGGLYWDRALLPETAYRARLSRIQARIAACGDEAWLLYADVENHGNVVYATNFMPRVRSVLAFVPKTGEPILLANIGLRDVPAAKTITWVDEVRPFGKLPKELVALIEEKGLAGASLGVCGFDRALPVVDWLAIQKGLPRAVWRSRDDEIAALRAPKENWERVAIRRAGVMATEALRQVPKIMRPGLSIRQLLAEIDRGVRRLGVEDTRFLVASGPQTGVSLRPPDDRILAPGDVTMLYLAVQNQRYWAESAATFVLGAAPDALRALHGAASAAVGSMTRAARSDAPASAVAKAGLAALPDAARASAALYGLGHGIGLDAAEGVVIAADAAGRLQEHETLALRAVLHADGVGVIAGRTVAVGGAGGEPFTGDIGLTEIKA